MAARQHLRSHRCKARRGCPGGRTGLNASRAAGSPPASADLSPGQSVVPFGVTPAHIMRIPPGQTCDDESGDRDRRKSGVPNAARLCLALRSSPHHRPTGGFRPRRRMTNRVPRPADGQAHAPPTRRAARRCRRIPPHLSVGDATPRGAWELRAARQGSSTASTRRPLYRGTPSGNPHAEAATAARQTTTLQRRTSDRMPLAPRVLCWLSLTCLMDPPP